MRSRFEIGQLVVCVKEGEWRNVSREAGTGPQHGDRLIIVQIELPHPLMVLFGYTDYIPYLGFSEYPTALYREDCFAPIEYWNDRVQTPEKATKPEEVSQ